MTAPPIITVVMSCYNAERTLHRAIDSVLRQSMSHFRMIIVDDASTDRTASILEKYRSNDDRIQISTNESNLGLAASLNKAIRQVDTPWIARMDADDTCHPSRLEKQISFVQRHPHIDILGTAIYQCRQDGSVINTRTLPADDVAIKKRIFRKPLVYHPTILIKKSVYDDKAIY